MAKISCDAVKCIYNCDRGCCLDQIRVDGSDADNYNETECASFSDKKGAMSMKGDKCCNGISEKCGTEHCSITCENSGVACSADKCMYNSNYYCTADKISIGTCYASDCSETRCETFTQ